MSKRKEVEAATSSPLPQPQLAGYELCGSESHGKGGHRLQHFLPCPASPEELSVNLSTTHTSSPMTGAVQTETCTLQSLMKFVLTPKSKVMRRKLVHSLTRQFQTAVLKLQKDIFFYCLQISINDIEPPHPPIISLNRRSDLRSFTKLITVIVSCLSGNPLWLVKGRHSFIECGAHRVHPSNASIPTRISLGSHMCL